jgi:hypothetical protein
VGISRVAGNFQGLGTQQVPIVVRITGRLTPQRREAFKVELEDLARRFNLRVSETGAKASNKKPKKRLRR